MPVVTFYPSAFHDDYSYASISNQNAPIGKSSTNTTYSTIDLKTGMFASTYFYYKFDLSSIPDNAIINSVSCKAKVTISSTSSLNDRNVQLYYGGTAKGTAVAVTTSGNVLNIPAGTWSVEELRGAMIRCGATRGFLSANTARNFKFYGADLIVDYTVPVIEPEILYVKINGSWRETTPYKKVNGVWVEQANKQEIYNLLESGIYKKG